MLCIASVLVRNYGRRNLGSPDPIPSQQRNKIPRLEHFESSPELGQGMNLFELYLNVASVHKFRFFSLVYTPPFRTLKKTIVTFLSRT